LICNNPADGVPSAVATIIAGNTICAVGQPDIYTIWKATFSGINFELNIISYEIIMLLISSLTLAAAYVA